MTSIRIVAGIVFSAVAFDSFAQQSSSLRFHGFVTARGVSVKAPPSWVEGGVGRFDVGARGPDDRRTVHAETAQLGVDWSPTSWLLLHADGLARREPSGSRGESAGLLQAYVDFWNDRWRLRAGTFWLPTSRENTEPLWTSKYTMTYSALNTWIGQEVRPIGVDLQYTPNFYVTIGGTAFRGNDTMGTVLSDRGWTSGSRLTVYNERLPRPPLPFVEGTTRPIGRDLDDENGYAARVRLQLPERAMLQLTRIDNRAPLVPELRGEEPWLTKFNILAIEAGSTSPSTVTAEWARGWTAVGFPGGSFRMDFETAYVLLSHKRDNDRWTARVERFSTRDHADVADDPSRENGRALTFAWFRNLRPSLRLGLEYVLVDGDRPGVALAGFDPRVDGTTFSVELRYAF